MPKKEFAGLDATVGVVARLLNGHVVTIAQLKKDLDLKDAAATRWFNRLAKLPGVIEERVRGRRSVKFATLIQRPRSGPTDVAAACLMSSLASALKETRLKHHVESIHADVLSRSKHGAAAEHLDKKFWFVTRGGDVALPKHEQRLSDLIDAIVGSLGITFDYRHFDGEREKGIAGQPLTLALYQHQFYVVVATAGAKSRAYRFARMTNVQLGRAFTYPSSYDPSQALQHVFGIWLSKETRVEKVRVLLSRRWRHYVESHRWHGTQSHDVLPNGEVIVELVVHQCPELEGWLAAFGPEAEVLEPASLRGRVVERAKATVARYSAKSPGLAAARGGRSPVKRHGAGGRA